MKRIRDFLSRPTVTIALFALALVLLGGSTLGGARAALTVESGDYQSQVNTSKIAVELLENGDTVEDGGTLLGDLLERGGDTALKTGKQYEESLAVYNPQDSAEEYVRVSVYKYWIDEKGNKYPAMDSKWIELGFATENGWSIDESSTTEERTVLYLADPLPSGSSSEFLKYVSIDNKAGKQVTQTGENVITTTYLYNDKSFCLEVHVDSVQTHNAEQAKLSAWGVNK